MQRKTPKGGSSALCDATPRASSRLFGLSLYRQLGELPYGVGCAAGDQEEATVEQDNSPEALAARERQAAMVEELRKAELVRDRLESLQQLVGSYPEGHDTRVLLEELHLERALGAVEENIGAIRETLFYPRGT
jgi:hypothetical protein